ncbi:methyl-accepting chemotaxis protein [Paragemmobacter straminiformis]|uniref:Methyl-accepting chemotaxis protein n=1 Tax=Paragemmobacter straminiformis TaxID=2045119 RepID=A0A842I598_9RHOB|nr:methyl-accepting chemotaxis protein [Gemmobacter straminiformis]MBC2834789.1 methyl-accepting chemotaxis protein [Gemmobacter straminiformis]
MTRRIPPSQTNRTRPRTDPLADLEPEPVTATADQTNIDPPLPTALEAGYQRTEDMAQEPTADAHIWDKMSAFETLDILSNPVMLADHDMVIRHVNEAGYQMFERIEAEIRRDLPNFRARDVIGKNIDVFHKNPHYQRGLMSGMVKPHDGKFTIGGRHLAFRATPKFTKGTEIGCIFVEWQDRTEVIKANTQVERLMSDIRKMAEDHSRGEIDQFISEDGYEPAFATVVREMNAMVVEHIETKKKVVACLAEIAQGNFSAQLEQFPGKKAFLNAAVEAMRSNLTSVIGEIERLSNAIVDGNLDAQSDRSLFTGDFIRIMNAFESAFTGLNGAFNLITQQVTQVATTVEQMSQSSQALATNSQIQSSSVDEVSASAEETDVQVKSNAAAATKASQLVTGASEVAEIGKGKINEMVTAMQGIRASSQDIAKIIKVIDEIAFQTNLLALNAAVEAARAGQHGRGFAVVAQEVRNLAGRSAKAARETSELIEDAATRVQSGVKIADETSRAFVTIADDIEKVKTLVTDIATASDEQARGVAQINIAIGEIAKSALSTSQQAEELAASSNEMQAATESMRSEMSRFRLRKTESRGLPGLSLEGVPAELMAQIQSMIAGQMGGGRAPAPARALAGGNRNSDRDQRGFGNF